VDRKLDGRQGLFHSNCAELLPDTSLGMRRLFADGARKAYKATIL
jgi:hypothetical protein